MQFEVFVDQAGNELPGGSPQFLGAEWGNVIPFALSDNDVDIYNKGGQAYKVYLDPGDPSFFDEGSNTANEAYRWGFTLVAEWASHLDAEDLSTLDISPGAIGNIAITEFPTDLADFQNFYMSDGGDIGTGYDLNPITNKPYEAQVVRRGDYARVLAGVLGRWP